jgi:uncharacterized protein (TIGR00297 family)
MAQEMTVPKGEWNGRNDSIGLLAAGCLLVWFLVTAEHVRTFETVDAAVLTLLFALAGYFSRGVSFSGAVAGWVIAFIFYATGSLQQFSYLFMVFALTWIATRLGRRRKEQLGVAEPKKGRRASQVIANLGAAGVCAVLFATGKHNVFFYGMMAALCEAAADTVSSEIGQAFGKNPRLITTFQSVSPGTNGGMTLIGTLAGCFAAGLVPIFSDSWYTMLIAIPCGIFGMFVDSLLGATLERRGYLNNDLVNLLGTTSAAALALLLSTIH